MRGDSGLGYQIEANRLWMIGKLLTIEAHVDHVEGIIIVKERDVRKLALNVFLRINPLHANPILYFCLRFCFRIALKSNGNTLSVFLN